MIGFAASIFSNPSGLAPVKHVSLEGAFARLPDRSTYGMGAVAFRLGDFNLGTGYQYLRFPGTDPVYDNLTWAGSVVYRIMGMAIGTTGRYVSVDERDGPITRAFTTDAGLTFAFFDIAALALSIQNLSRFEISGDPLSLPTTTRFGFSLNLLDTYSNGRLLATMETVWTAGEDRRTVLGVEGGAFIAGVGLVGRVGTGGQPETSLLNNTSWGGAIVLGRVAIDYAFQRHSPIGQNLHLLGVRWTP